ncbi:Williams-Beuren syndrome chromosomal region 27 protein [Plakobranchus ocellatus]|uniref:Williams-Beuren syndrome chromosomal region 27 protein n=1 Tax=Plakobranchus ocellatus TaxID=259542 RepID=A0AAV4AWG3_9GAST|nr:Williams-Beuren syndrome chromosomal region 27 protein [Plakobranchus ocellatus]
MQSDKLDSPEQWASHDFIEKTMFDTNLTYEESQLRYSHWVTKGCYDKTFANKPTVYAGPNALREGMKDLIADKSSARVLDIGCRTGLTGEILLELGYTNFDGLDPSKESLKIAREKGIFQNLYDCAMGGDTPVDIPDNTYDALCMSGVCAPGQLPVSALPELFRILKPVTIFSEKLGGYLLNCMREAFLETVPAYANRFVPLLETMEKEGKIHQVEWKIYPHHYMDREGVRMIYQKLY